MRFLERVGRALADETRLLLVALRDRRLALALGILAALLAFAAQVPLRYAIQVGQQDGVGSDLPILDGFYSPERDPHGLFRWTSDRSVIRLPGVGQRALQMTLKVFPVSPEVAQRGPREIEVWDGGQPITRLPTRPDGAIYHVLLPPPADTSGDHFVELRSATFVPTGDQRSIGMPVDGVYVTGAGGPALPAWRGMLGWLGVAALLWLALRRAGFGPPAALMLLLPGLLLAGLAALLDPPRFAFGARPALIALALSLLLVLLLRAAIPALAARLSIPLGERALRWLLLFALLVLALRYGGKLYPDSMPGDIGFHANRTDDIMRGYLLLLSKHRGVDFPYPPAFYLLLAPFSLLGASQRVLLQFGGALLDALSIFLVYAIVASMGRSAWCQRGEAAVLEPALIATAIYSFSTAGFMATWWNFSTHIFTQFAHLLLITALVLVWRATDDERRKGTIYRAPTNDEGRGSAGLLSSVGSSQWSVIPALVVMQLLVYLGHFGFWINMSLLWGIALAVLLAAALRGRVSWGVWWLALLSFIAAELLAGLLYYSAYAGLFLEQIYLTVTGGLTGLADRAPADRAILWQTLWDDGLRVHFGFFPIPLALGGLLLLRRRTKNQEPRTRHYQFAVLVLMAGTFAIGAFFAALPLLSGSSLATRWLMFSAWAIGVGAALSAQALWRYGRAGRLLVFLMGGYMIWITASVWLMALAWRIRPPEPF
ncbi:MAG TPA: hypothetical protein VF909_00640 [Roseiflexaceae bacterium]